jgi:hypothetical protein
MHLEAGKIRLKRSITKMGFEIQGFHSAGSERDPLATFYLHYHENLKQLIGEMSQLISCIYTF